MRNALAIARKELSIYFTTPWAYLVLTAMTAISAFFFMASLQYFEQVQQMARMIGWARLGQDYGGFKNLTEGVVSPLWATLSIVVLFVAPFLSMRLFAEERRQKTLELLMTSPVRPVEIVLGKYLSAVVIIGITVGVTIIFPLTLSAFGLSPNGHVLAWPTVLLGFGGLLLLGAVCMAVGMFISALTESQALAGVITVVVMICWALLRAVHPSGEPLRSIVSYLSFDEQLRSLFQGVLDLKAVVFFVSVILFSLLLTHRTLEAQRWT